MSEGEIEKTISRRVVRTWSSMGPEPSPKAEKPFPSWGHGPSHAGSNSRLTIVIEMIPIDNYTQRR